jgi:hypothetical protein
MAGEHFARTTGYERYAELAERLPASGLEKASGLCGVRAVGHAG